MVSDHELDGPEIEKMSAGAELLLSRNCGGFSFSPPNSAGELHLSFGVSLSQIVCFAVELF